MGRCSQKMSFQIHYFLKGECAMSICCKTIAQSKARNVSSQKGGKHLVILQAIAHPRSRLIILIAGLSMLFVNVGGAGGNFILRETLVDDTIEEGDGQSVADIDGDGHNNIIVGTGDGGSVYWYEKHSPDEWTRHLIVEGLIEIEGTEAADFNGDGNIEVVIFDQATADTSQPNVYIAKQDTDDPTGSWSTAVLDGDAPHVQEGIIFDVDEDGKLDIVYAYEGDGPNGGFYWLRNKGGAPLDAENWEKHEIDQVSGAWWIDNNSPKDFSGNGNAGDILVSVREGRNRAYSNGEISIYIRPDDPVNDSWEKIQVESGDDYCPLHVTSGDLTGNGDDRDVASGAYDRGGGLYVYDYDTWERTVIKESETWFNVHAEDINGDGRSELITCSRSKNELRIYVYNPEIDKYISEIEYSIRKIDDEIIFDDIDGDGYHHEFWAGNDDRATGGIRWFKAYDVEER